LEPDTFSDAKAALANTAHMYRRNLWIDQHKHFEVWCEKDAIRGVVYPVTEEYHVRLLISCRVQLRDFSCIRLPRRSTRKAARSAG
jgi:hypothetical protein